MALRKLSIKRILYFTQISFHLFIVIYNFIFLML
nr:MAG TPA: hypothetical protein [Caudoviricetes sp.]